jgi:hypothetical protein
VKDPASRTSLHHHLPTLGLSFAKLGHPSDSDSPEFVAATFGKPKRAVWSRRNSKGD